MSRSRTFPAARALVALACAVAGLGGAVGAPAAADVTQQSPTAVTTTTSPFRMGTYNIRADKSLADFSAGINEYAPYVDVFGLQEIVGLERMRWVSYHRQDIAFYQAPDILQVPVLWNRSVFDFVSGTEYKLADQAQTESGLKKTTYAPAVHLLQAATGRTITVINVHLIQGAVKRGVKNPDKPLTYKYYVHQVAGMKAAILAERQKHADWPVYVLGDFNIGYEQDSTVRKRPLPYHQLTGIHMTSIWKGRKLQASGTHIDEDGCGGGAAQCGAYIDQVWGPGAAASARVLTGIVHSDHYPVTSTYQVPVPLGFVPATGTVGFSSLSTSFNEGNKDYQGRHPHCIDLSGVLDHGWARVDVSGTATKGEDFQMDVTARDGCVDLYVTPDHDDEGDETITLSLVDPVNTVVTIPQTTVTITNDD